MVRFGSMKPIGKIFGDFLIEEFLVSPAAALLHQNNQKLAKIEVET